MAIIVQSRVVFNSFVIKGNQVLSCLTCHLLSHLLFELIDCHQDRVNLHVLNRRLGDFGLQNQPLLLVLLLVSDALTFQILYDHGNAVVGVLVHQHVQYPGFLAFDSAPVHSDLVVRHQAVINLLKSSETAPGLQLSDVLDFGVSLEHHEVLLRDH